MKHSDIYEKFKIEYDKANITSSYPSLTDYEIATILDKAYLALIAQKLTGNNKRGVAFEADVKAIEDIRPLITSGTINVTKSDTKYNSIENSIVIENTIQNVLYYMNSVVVSNDNKTYNTILINHTIAPKFFWTNVNRPWIETPGVLLEGDDIIIFYNKYQTLTIKSLNVTYVKQPVSFVDSIDTKDTVEFELNSTIAEELINLAIAMSLETVESPRLKTKLETMALES